MLILVAVSVSILVQSDLIGITEEAANKYETASKQNLAEVTIDGKTYENVNDYINKVEKVKEVHDWKYLKEDGKDTRAKIQCTCDECKKISPEGQTINIGQEVQNTNVAVVNTGATVMRVNQMDMAEGTEKWVVLGIEDKNKNGTNEGLLITTLEPSTEVAEIPNNLKSYYNDGISIIDAKCKEVYGEDARAMTVEDVNKALGMNITGGMYLEENDLGGPWSGDMVYDWVKLNNFDTTVDSIGIWEEIKTYHSETCGGLYYTPDHPEGTNDATKLGNLKITGYQYYATAERSVTMDYAGCPSVSEDTSNVVKNIVFGEECDYHYSLASKCISAVDDSGSNTVNFIIFEVWDGCVDRYVWLEFNNSFKRT